MERPRVNAITLVALFVALSVLTIAPASPAAAPPPADGVDGKLEAADRAFKVQNYAEVVRLLQPLLPQVRDGKLVTEAFQRIKFLERLAAAMWFEEQRDAARRVFTDLLKAAPTYRLEALFYPEELIRFFENHRADLVSYGVIGKGGGTSDGPRQIKVREKTINTAPTFAYLMPFGVGQFVNGDDTKGAIVLTLQLIGIIGSVAAYYGVESLKGFDKNQPEAIASEDVNLADALRGVSIGSYVVFGSALLFGIIDGFVSRGPTATTVERTEVVDPDDDKKPPAVTPAPTTSLRVGPAPLGLGLGLSGTF